MRAALNWKDYELLDASESERLERWGNTILIRPDPQVLWQTPKTHPLWHKAHARYHRANTGGGRWEIFREPSADWKVTYNDLQFRLKLMGFKHTGLFPEQAVNWDWMADRIRAAGRPIRVLNLFGYTGAATLACAAAGAHVTHVDAAKNMVAWGKENATMSGLSDRPMRWLVDDCMKFVAREQRRGNTYEGILMDPPSYGRGPNGETWKLEEQVYGLIRESAKLLSNKPLFFLVNSYTTGLSPSAMGYMLGAELTPRYGGTVSADEIGLPVTQTGLVLPCGATALWQDA